MMRPKRLRARAVVMGFFVVGFMAACSQFSLYDQFQALSAPKDLTSAATALSVSPGISGTLVGGTLYFTASGGTPPYTYAVLSGGVGGTITASGTYTAPGSSGPDTIQVSDAGGQVANSSVTVVAAPPLAIVPTTLRLNVGDSYNFSATGGVPPYTYVLTGTGAAVTSGGALTTSGSGTATVTVTDYVGNTATAAVTVVAAGSGTLTLSPATVTISEAKTLYVMATGGTGTYTNLTASKGQTQPVSSSTHAGTYSGSGWPGSNTLTLTDSSSATATATVTVYPAAPSNLVATVSSSTEVDLSWTNNSSSTSGINVYRAKGTGGFTLLTTVLLASSVMSYQDTYNLTGNTVYTYKVVAVKNGSGGPFTGTSNYAVAVTH